MSVLIKGIDKPRDCYSCWLKGCVHKYMYFKDCPIREVPTPHGRLIDASQFEVFGYDAIEGSFDDGVTFVLNKIDDAPTVIEEEK